MTDIQFELPLFPLGVVLFPKAILPIRIFEERYKIMLTRVLQKDRQFGVVLIKSGVEAGGPAVPCQIGTVAKVSNIAPMGRGRLAVTTVGEKPFRILRLIQEQPYLVGLIELLTYEAKIDAGVWEVADQVKQMFRSHLRLFSQLTGQPLPRMSLYLDAEELSYLVGFTIQVNSGDKQDLLETPDLLTRLNKELDLMAKENSVLKQYIMLHEKGLDEPPPADKPYAPRFSKN